MTLSPTGRPGWIGRCGLHRGPGWWLVACAVVVGTATPLQWLSAQDDPRQALLSVSIAPETVTVGQRFTVRVRVRAPKVAMVTFPEVPSASDGVDPVDPRVIDDGPPGDVLDRTATYAFAAWDVGVRAPKLDPVTVSVGGRAQRFVVGAPSVVVRSLLPKDSAHVAPREARDPIPLPGRLWQYTILALLVAAGLLWWWRRRHSARAAVGERRAGEAWDEARKAYATLDTVALAAAGETGRHVIAHVDVMRTYLARRFPTVDAGLQARDATTQLMEVDFPVPVRRVAALLERDAEVRFAHAAVDAREAEALAHEARDITDQVQLAHEARLRALERPPRPRRR